jgi:O-glycosyl hydrolase
MTLSTKPTKPTKPILVLACAALAAGCKVAAAPERPTHAVVTVDLGTRLQTIEGLGGFGPKKLWGDTAPYFDEQYLDRIVGELGTSVIRTQLYWDLEPENDDGDPRHTDLAKLRFGPDSYNGKQLPFLRAIAARGVKVIASAWTPPIWMKVAPDDHLAFFCHGQCGGHLDPAKRDEYAEYLAAYVKLLEAKAGVHLYALSISNEPLFANPFESCVYTEADYAKTLEVVGARFRADRLGTKLFGPEHMGSFKWNAAFFEHLLDDREAARSLDIYAVHSYLDGVRPDYGSADGWSRMAERVEAAGKPLWMTETSGYDGSWAKAFETARGLHLALRYGHVSGWLYWAYADNIFTKGGEPNPLFYALESYYRFIRPGATQVGSSSTDESVLVTAFRRGPTLTVVLVNNAEGERRLALRVAGGALPAPLAGYRTSERESFVKLVGVDAAALVLPARSLTTLVAGPTP